MQSDNEKMLQEIVQNTEMGKNTLDELMSLTHAHAHTGGGALAVGLSPMASSAMPRRRGEGLCKAA